jgi:hypothetical protein
MQHPTQKIRDLFDVIQFSDNDNQNCIKTYNNVIAVNLPVNQFGCIEVDYLESTNLIKKFDLYLIRKQCNINPEYVCQYLATKQGTFVIGLISGVVQRKANFLDSDIPVPSIDVQNAIVYRINTIYLGLNPDEMARDVMNAMLAE